MEMRLLLALLLTVPILFIGPYFFGSDVLSRRAAASPRCAERARGINTVEDHDLAILACRYHYD